MSPRKTTQSQSERTQKRTQLKNVALFTDQDRVEAKNVAVPTLPLEKIIISQHQPRSYFDPDKLEQLTISVKEHGVLEPLLVRPAKDGNYELVAGERRFRAASAASLEEVPVVVKELTDSEALQLSLVENLQREDLNPVEETEGILQLLSLNLKLEIEEVVSLLYQMQNATAGKITDSVISKSKTESVNEVFTGLGKMNRESFTANRLSILGLPQVILEAIRQGKIAYTKGKAIARVDDEAARTELLENAIANNLSLSQIRELIKQLKPVQEKEQIKNSFNTTYKKVKKSKQLWEDPKKIKKLKSLLSQLEKLVEESE